MTLDPAPRNDGCVFCGIATGTEPAHVVSESDRAIAFLDVNPAADGHTLVIPRGHATDIWELSGGDADEVWRLTVHVADRLREVLAPDGLTLFQANGRAGWQHVFHFHMHLVPRWRDDRLQRPWAMIPADPMSLDAVAGRLRTD
jgi:histidine triad (HIT) family protein